MTKKYQICTKCVMDTSDSNISFNKLGVCNHCLDYKIRESIALKHDKAGQSELSTIIQAVKSAGKNNKYDCIIGLSGGVDSTYVAYKVKKMGLRPLAVHFDSGWNSELAVKNIENIVKKLEIDLYTYVCDWQEMQDLQLSYFKAGVINADIPMDHAFMVILHRIAKKHKVKYFFSGHNFETEAILPKSWVYKATDSINIKSIQRKFGSLKLKKYPLESIVVNLYFRFIYGLNQINILDYEKYDKTKAMNLIESELDWVYYGGKHYESIFTRFYQGYYLPTRFNVDKRRAHLSSLINSNQLSREAALEELSKPSYSDEDLLNQDKKFIPKKLGVSDEYFSNLILEPIKDHEFYGNDIFIRNFIKKIAKLILKKDVQL